MVYWLPHSVLAIWSHVAQQNWGAVGQGCERLGTCVRFLHDQFDGRGFTDTAFDRLGGIASGFLRSGLRSRAPYPSPTAADVRTLRAWFGQHFPEERYEEGAEGQRHRGTK